MQLSGFSGNVADCRFLVHAVDTALLSQIPSLHPQVWCVFPTNLLSVRVFPMEPREQEP